MTIPADNMRRKPMGGVHQPASTYSDILTCSEQRAMRL
jgi:hypothetical protein